MEFYDIRLCHKVFKMALPMRMRTLLRKSRVCFILSRLSHSDCVRVRFAPSPTGELHLGGLRTALFNFLFAKSHNGKFVLRIENTDVARTVTGAAEKVELLLKWAGLTPDESPTIGGQYGPYLQSERLAIYNESVETLIKSGHCYHCFCTERRLNLLRKEAAKRGEVPQYDNKCRHLTKSEVEEKLSQNIPYVIRFKYEPLESAWNDLIYGRKHEKSVGESLECDFVVMKTDGYPTYHFANVIDDHHMKITHVLRGEEWSISTPKHLQMFQAFGWEPPKYAHLPLILNSDGTKLSKRFGDVNVESFKNEGYDPNALLNYLTSINKGFTEDTAGKTLHEMINIFSLDRLNSHSARLQPEKLKHLNKSHLERRFNSERRSEVIQETQAMLKDHYKKEVCNSHVLKHSYIERALSWALEHRIYLLDHLLSKHLEFMWVVPKVSNIKNVASSVKNADKTLLGVIDKLKLVTNFEESALKETLVCYCKENELKMKVYMGLLRCCLSQQKEGPSVAEMMEILGKEETLKRLNSGLSSLKL